jgi:hypothetical protein
MNARLAGQRQVSASGRQERPWQRDAADSDLTPTPGTRDPRRCASLPGERTWPARQQPTPSRRISGRRLGGSVRRAARDSAPPGGLRAGRRLQTDLSWDRLRGELPRCRYFSAAPSVGEMSAVRQLKPRDGAPAAPSPSPPGRKAGNEVEPPAVFRVAASGSRCWHPWPAPVGDLDPDDVVSRLDRDRDRLAGGTRPAMPQAIGEKLAHQQGGHVPAGVPGT